MKGKNLEKTTSKLDEMLKNTDVRSFGDYLRECSGDMADGDNPFGEYVKGLLREKGMSQKELFLRAGIDEKTGYKYISGEKHTPQRDIIIRLCLCAKMTLKECSRALKLYGMSPLYAKTDRDAALIIAFNRGIYETDKADEILERYGLEKLYEPVMREEAADE